MRVKIIALTLKCPHEPSQTLKQPVRSFLFMPRQGDEDVPDLRDYIESKSLDRVLTAIVVSAVRLRSESSDEELERAVKGGSVPRAA
jgi:hypothetical protein